ncbi:hypothetical protein PV518_14560 [Streptomyces sp. ND04-05B]|uniref:hypothetical protein n=1 Tax=Streptomyces sp. ND04-05B TaxID=3028693 RepID=UPI0029AA5E3E|nr:hypothetical protein [Streptomyces sp. ND04-05B]MDX3063390.1 hypothetical protein [Streptomyces sp. ND04-05B]
MNGRKMYAPTVAILVVGITLGLLGIFEDGGDVSRAGILIAFASLPPLCYWQTQRAHDAVEDQVADAHEAGYRLALEHVAKGLLSRKSAPPDGGKHVEPVADRAHLDDDRAAGGTAGPVVPDNVRPLRLIRDDYDERKIV